MQRALFGGNQMPTAATAPKQTFTKVKGSGNVKPVTQSYENNFVIQNNNVGFQNNYTLGNMVQNTGIPSFKRKINEQTDTRLAKRSNVSQPEPDNAFGVGADIGMGQKSILTPPDSGLTEVHALLPVAQAANMGQQSATTAPTSKFLIAGNGMTFPVPNPVVFSNAPVTKAFVAQQAPVAKTIVTQPAPTTTSTGKKPQNSIESSPREPSKSPSKLAAGPIKGAAPENNTVSAGVNTYFLKQTNNTALGLAFQGLPKCKVVDFITERNKRQNAVDVEA
ncbi:hypothetical protein B0J13DRAFT_274470 [Dactylonectria estremocensis]|uniref:Uncharacterized protein n=1 Tax=Dactylonectria estremocensis TaxID=1079267 RepID=A0A9P9F2A8_9HYPO|nr:hypothetical protein B0J13DRAFT_274470 [Dactylonectria estremocensis]